jgi:hypothetical protein
MVGGIMHATLERFDAASYIVLAPTTHMDALPAGTRIVVTEVRVDARADTYRIAGDQRLIGKPMLDQIANAAGISWIEERRTDDRSHPHYVEMLVRGTITDFDGSSRTITGSKAIDLRADAGGGESGKDYAEIAEKAKRGGRSPDRQLMEARKFICEIAASKAKNRAIAAALGIKRSYTEQELRRSFIVPKLVPDTADPRAQRAVLATMMGASEALFGGNGRVVDASFEEPQDPAQPLPGEVGEEAGAITTAPASNTAPEPVDDSQIVGSPEVIAIIVDAWGKASDAGMSGQDFRSLVKARTGREHREDCTIDDAHEIARAVVQFLAQVEDRADEVPF